MPNFENATRYLSTNLGTFGPLSGPQVITSTPVTNTDPSNSLTYQILFPVGIQAPSAPISLHINEVVVEGSEDQAFSSPVELEAPFLVGDPKEIIGVYPELEPLTVITTFSLITELQWSRVKVNISFTGGSPIAIFSSIWSHIGRPLSQGP